MEALKRISGAVGLIPFLRRSCRALRLIRYDLFFGTRTGRVTLGEKIWFEPAMRLELEKGVWLNRLGTFHGNGHVRIGARTYIGCNFSIHCVSEVVIGRDCLFGNFASLIDNNHGTMRHDLIRRQPLESAPIIVGDNCWIGEKATLLPGVTLGDGVVVAAGAVVRGNISANSVVAGVPAKTIRMRV